VTIYAQEPYIHSKSTLWFKKHFLPSIYIIHHEQGVTLTRHNTTGPPCRVTAEL